MFRLLKDPFNRGLKYVVGTWPGVEPNDSALGALMWSCLQGHVPYMLLGSKWFLNSAA